MRKIIVSVLTLLMGVGSANAENYYFNVIEQKESRVMLSIPLSQEPQMEYAVDSKTNNDLLLLKTKGLKKATIVLDQRYDFSYTTNRLITGSIVSSVCENSVSKSDVKVDGETIYVSGLKPDAVAKVYAANGTEYVSAKANADGVAVVNLPSHVSGVVIVKAGGTAFKLIMK